MKYEKQKDYTNAEFGVDPEDLTDEERMQVLNILIRNIRIKGEAELKASIPSKETLSKFYVVEG